MKRFGIYKRLSKNVGSVNRILIILTGFKMWRLFCEFIPLFLYSIFINEILVSKRLDRVWEIIVAYAMVYIIVTLGVISEKKYSNMLGIKYDFKVRRALLKKYINGQEFFCDVGEIRNNVESDSQIVGKFLSVHLVEFGYSIGYAALLSGVLIFFDWRIAVLSFIFVPLTFVVTGFFGKKVKETSEKLRDLQAHNEMFMFTAFQNWKEIKSSNLEEDHMSELSKQYEAMKKISIVNQLCVHVGVTFSFFIKNFITKLYIYFVGGFFVICGYSQVGVLLVFIKYYEQFFSCIQKISDSLIDYKSDSVKLDRVIKTLEIKDDDRPYIKIVDSDICINNVSFKHVNTAFALENISFSVNAGEHIAIVGESGSGKSTIIKLLSGQYVPNTGEIYIGGVNIQSICEKSLFKKISVVSQDVALFNLSIRENLLLAKPNASEEELIRCCRSAGIYEFINMLPEGFETIIGEQGVKVSGGQKQRLAIARAMLKDADILILDESTSALDVKTEKEILSEFDRFVSGKTVISIAHRLTAISNCDKVLVLDEGKMLEFDTHENLRKNSEKYNLLFGNQYGIK